MNLRLKLRALNRNVKLRFRWKFCKVRWTKTGSTNWTSECAKRTSTALILTIWLGRYTTKLWISTSLYLKMQILQFRCCCRYTGGRRQSFQMSQRRMCQRILPSVSRRLGIAYWSSMWRTWNQRWNFVAQKNVKILIPFFLNFFIIIVLQWRKNGRSCHKNLLCLQS